MLCKGAAGTRWLSEGKVDTKLRQRPSNWRIVTNVCWEADSKKSVTRIVCETFVHRGLRKVTGIAKGTCCIGERFLYHKRLDG